MLRKISFQQVALFFWIFFQSSLISIIDHQSSLFIVWNIGQGQWTTYVEGDSCFHFDFGGEIKYFYLNRNKIQNLCSQKNNVLFLSHADSDHYNFLFHLRKTLPKIQIATVPQSQPPYLSKLIFGLPFFNRKLANLTEWRPQLNPLRKYSKNDSSSVIQLTKKYLIPGDSTVNMENIWINKFSHLDLVKILILGHHGSRTSTSLNLIKKLPQLKMAIASARYKKYKHPHKEVIQRLKKFNLNIIKTEDWGNLIFTEI